jgi:NADPH2:quinone reductase
MKAIRVHEFGGPDVLRYDDVPLPEPGPGEARVKLAATGVNFIDIYHRKGQYPGQMPLTLGQEGAGIVDAVGAGVSEVQVGDQVVYASVQGAYAEYALVPAARLVQVPAGVSLEQAAALMLQGLTAHYLALSTFPLKPGDTALVHAAGGGVGQLLVQIAKRRGARVIATASAAKLGLARAAGADEAIDYDADDFAAAVKQLTGGRGADVVYDSVGKTTFDGSLNSLRPRGYLVLYGQSSGPVPPLDPQVLNSKGSLFLTRPTLGHHVATREELLARTNDLFGWVQAGELKIAIDTSFALADAAEAHRYLEARKTKGKVLLIP